MLSLLFAWKITSCCLISPASPALRHLCLPHGLEKACRLAQRPLAGRRSPFPATQRLLPPAQSSRHQRQLHTATPRRASKQPLLCAEVGVQRWRQVRVQRREAGGKECICGAHAVVACARGAAASAVACWQLGGVAARWWVEGRGGTAVHNCEQGQGGGALHPQTSHLARVLKYTPSQPCGQDGRRGPPALK